MSIDMLSIISDICFTTLLYTPPLLYAGLGSCICEKSGIINIGIEGMMTIGAFVGCTVAYFTGNPLLAFLVSGLVGMLLSMFLGISIIIFNADQTIAGTAINLIGTGFAAMASFALFGSSDTLPISVDKKIPILFQNFFDENTNLGWLLKSIFSNYLTTYLVFVLVIIVFFVIYKTKFGMHLRACGEHPKACETLGISVIKVRFICVLISGFLAGLGGACITMAITNQYRVTSVIGQGYIAIASVIFGKYNPFGVMLGCLLFGFCNGLKVMLSNYNISPHLLSMIPYLITILVLVIFMKSAVAPKASGKNYVRDN